MNPTTTKKSKTESLESESTAINDWKTFDQAVIKAQGNILSERNPTVEVTPEFIKAISGGHDVDSITYGKPGVRVFKEGMAKGILDREAMDTDSYYDFEIKKKNAEARK